MSDNESDYLNNLVISCSSCSFRMKHNLVKYWHNFGAMFIFHGEWSITITLNDGG